MWPEQVQDFNGGGAGWPEPVRFAGIELGDLAGAEGEVAVSEDDAEFAGQDVEPFVAGVRDESRFPGCEDLLENLDPARVLGEGHQDAALLPAVRLQVHAGVAGRRRCHQLVQRDAVRSRQRDEHLAWAGYLITAAAAAAFITVELRRREPLMDLGLFRRPSFSTAVLGAVTLFAALTLTLLLNTLYLQHTRGWTPLTAGIATLPMALGATLCAPLSGHLVGRFGPRRPLFLAGMFITAGGASLVNLGQHTNVALLLLAYLLIGTGFGFANAPITNTAVTGLPPARAGVAGAITSTARQLGSAIGIAIAGGLAARTPPGLLARASHPGWLIVTACGIFLFAAARAARPAA